MVTTEFNIEGNPREQKFVDLVLKVKPEQVTLVPDEQGQLTSNHGWDTVANRSFLKEILQVFKQAGIRTSVFVDAVPEMVVGAKECGSDRVELYTESYARDYLKNREKAIEPFIKASLTAEEVNIDVNAGHDLSLENLKYFAKNIHNLKEVSIGHALISVALLYGMDNTVKLYLRELMQ